MRKWVVVAGVVLVALAGTVGFALLNVNRWLERNRAWVAGKASEALGREVAFDGVGVSLRGGLSARLENLRVADDPRYGREPFVQAKEVRVALRILPALARRIEVRYVVIDSPALTVIRDARGLNVDSIGGGKKAEESGAERPAGESGAAAALLVSSIRIDDGRLRFVDRTVDPPAERVIDRLDVRASDVSPTTAIRLRVAAAVLGAGKQNVEVEGTAGPVAGREVPVDVTVRLDGVAPYDLSGALGLKGRVARTDGGPPAVVGTATLRSLAAAPPGAPRLSDFDATIELKGDSAVVPPSRLLLNGVPVEVEATVERFQPVRLRFGAKAAELDLKRLGYGGEGVREPEVVRDLTVAGTAELAPAGPQARVSVRSPRGALRDVPYEGLETEAALAGQVVTLERLRVSTLGGSCEGSGHVDASDASRPRFEGRSIVRGMVLRDLLARGFPAAAKQIEGRLDANLSLTGAGRDWDAIRPTLGGQGRVDVRDGVLKDVNVAESVLGGMTGVAGLTTLVPPDVRSRYPDVFGSGDTRFEQLGGSVRIGGQRVTTDDLRMAAPDYAVDGRGAVGFDGRVDFTATLVTSERLTADIGARVREARYVTNEQGRLAIPFRFVGKMPGVKPVPDAEWVAKTLARGAVGKGIEKLLGGKRGKDGERLRKGLQGLFGR